MNNNSENYIPIDRIPRKPLLQDIKNVEDLASRIKDLENEARNVKFVLGVGQYVIIGIIIVFFLALFGFALDAWKFHANTYKEYTKTINCLEDKIQNLKTINLEARINRIEKKMYSKGSR